MPLNIERSAPPVRIERVRDRIHAKIDWMGGRGPELAKMVSGASWAKATKRWTYPLNLEVCRQFREVFGESLEIGPELWAWASDAKQHEFALRETLNIDLSKPIQLERVPLLAPGMWEAMQRKGYQPAVAVFAKTARNFLNADAPGLGKTVETFASLLEAGVSGSGLVIAPRTSLRATWASEVEKWLGEYPGGAAAYACLGSSKQKQAVIEAFDADPAALKFLCVNAEMVRLKEARACPRNLCNGDNPYCDEVKLHAVERSCTFPYLFETEWDFAIGDETHKYLINANPRAYSKSMVGLGFQRIGQQVKESGMKIALSGTPMKGKPRLLWPTLHWLNPTYYTSQHRWNKMYFVMEPNQYATSGETVTDHVREDRMEALGRELDSIMIRRTKSELRKINPDWAPPDKQYMEVWVDLEAKQRERYNQITSGSSVDGGTVNGILAELTRLKQAAGCYMEVKEGTWTPKLPSAKYDWLADTFLPSLGITGKAETDQGDVKVIVASQFSKFIDLWTAELVLNGVSCFKLTGDTPDDQRESMQKRFQQPGGPRVFLFTTTAGGQSITLDSADHVVIMDETWVPDEQEQVEDRAHRASDVDHQVTIWYVRAKDTLEWGIAGEVYNKDTNQKRVLDGRRGIEWAQRTLGAKQ